MQLFQFLCFLRLIMLWASFCIENITTIFRMIWSQIEYYLTLFHMYLHSFCLLFSISLNAFPNDNYTHFRLMIIIYYLNLSSKRRRLQSEFTKADDSNRMTIFVRSGDFRRFAFSDVSWAQSGYGIPGSLVQMPQSLIDLMNLRLKKPLKFIYNVLLMIILVKYFAN